MSNDSQSALLSVFIVSEQESNSRREFVKSFGALVGLAFVGRTDAANASELKTTDGEFVGVVEGADGEVLSVRADGHDDIYTVPYRDFPQGWSFKAGDRVCVTNWPEDGSYVARPFVRVSPLATPVLRGGNVVFGDMAGTLSNGEVRSAMADAIQKGDERYGLFVENVDGQLTAFGVLHGQD